MMKICKRLLLGLTLALGSLSLAQAQFMRAGFYVTPSIPIGQFAEEKVSADTDGLGANTGFGGKAFLNYYTNPNFHIGLEAGYQFHGFERDLSSINMNMGTLEGQYSIVPVQLTAAYHTDAESILDVYFGTGVGMFLLDDKYDEEEFDDLYASDAEALIGFSPRIGLSYEISDNVRFNGNVAYNILLGNTDEGQDGVVTGYPDLSYLDVNLGLAFLIFD